MIGVVADIEQMFFGFIVAEEDRNYLRFLWHRDNDPDKELVEYRMCKHVFGNSPSPAIATYGLRKAVSVNPTTSEEVVKFVNKNFYVDDGLLSTTTPEKAVEIMKKTQAALLTGGNLRLHKVASNNKDVVNAFPPEERASDLENMDLSVMDDVPLQRSLGLLGLANGFICISSLKGSHLLKEVSCLLSTAFLTLLGLLLHLFSWVA